MSADYVDKIKKGAATYDVKDPRLPDAAVADEGKVVKVGEDGNYELGEAGGGGGTKLYKHSFTGVSAYQSCNINIITTDPTPFTIISQLINANPGVIISGYLTGGGVGSKKYPIWFGYTSEQGVSQLVVYWNYGSSTSYASIPFDSEITDAVTEL